MARWRVQLTGERFDLEELPKLFNDSAAQVVEQDGTFFLVSTEFEQLASADAVREEAVSLVASVNGAARLAFSGFRPVGLGSVHEESPQGRSINVAMTEGVVVRTKASAVIVKPDQSPPPPPESSVTNKWIKSALTDKAAQRVLRFLSRRPATWQDLYKVMEILESSGGHGVLPQAGISKNELGRFSQTANSMHAIGDHARHAKESLPAPKKPKSLEEAWNLISRWTRAWLAGRST